MDFAERIAASFAKQGMMKTLGATLGKISSGAVEVELKPSPEIAQQHGFVHAGAITAIADNACGFSAQSDARRDWGFDDGIQTESRCPCG